MHKPPRSNSTPPLASPEVIDGDLLRITPHQISAGCSTGHVLSRSASIDRLIDRSKLTLDLNPVFSDYLTDSSERSLSHRVRIRKMRKKVNNDFDFTSEYRRYYTTQSDDETNWQYYRELPTDVGQKSTWNRFLDRRKNFEARRNKQRTKKGKKYNPEHSDHLHPSRLAYPLSPVVSRSPYENLEDIADHNSNAVDKVLEARSPSRTTLNSSREGNCDSGKNQIDLEDSPQFTRKYLNGTNSGQNVYRYTRYHFSFPNFNPPKPKQNLTRANKTAKSSKWTPKGLGKFKRMSLDDP